MSASVATSTVGLLDRPFTPPTDHRDSRVAEWHDQMDIDRSSQEQNMDRPKEATNISNKRAGSDSDTGNERRNALSGLLAALATNSNTSGNNVQHVVSGRQDREHRSVTPPQDSPISIASPSSQVASAEVLETKEQPGRDARTAFPQVAAPDSVANEARLPQLPTNNGSHNGTVGPAEPAIQTILDHPQSDAAVLIPPSLDNLPIPAFEMPSDPILSTPPPNSSPINIKRQYDAFARLEFDDGIFYLNTYQCELGRDQHAYHIALRREREAQEAAEMAKPNPESSRGRASQISNIIKAESQIQGSVVSEAGGFAGVDEQPVEGYGQNQNGQAGRSGASRSSDASIVRPADVLHNPSLHTPFDYNKEASRQFAPPAPPNDKAAEEEERPAPVTADHLPDPNSCPLIPIHVTSESETTELDGLKAISRRHMKIFWSWENSSFMLEVLGRNGAFLEGDFIAPAEVVPLYTGANIQISSVNFVFRLPHIEAESPSADNISNMGEPLEAMLTNASDQSESAQKNKLKLKLNLDGTSAHASTNNGESKRRGPGRPPKDGVMSQRERKEREKADKEAKTRALNGDPSPPVPQRKPSKSQLPNPEPVAEPPKPEKRKYNKRKRDDGEEEQVLPSIEAADETPIVETPQPQPVAKKARTKSYSPPYKPKEECTQADLTRPAHNYAVLLYQVLSQTGEISLRQIYKEMQSRWPFFKYMVESDGWTSSVRHNLNQEVGKLFVKGRKEGKGYTWLAKPNAMEEYQAQKNKRSNAPTAPRPRPAPARANFGPSQGQQLTWQNSGPAPQTNGVGGAMGQPGQWNGPPNNQNRPGQPGVHPNGQSPMPGHAPSPATNMQDPEGPAPPHMIVTFLGVRIIDRFENTMMGQLKQRYQSEEEKMTKWANVFRSARARCLNGSPASSLPEGETEDERTIMTHINNFVKMYKNPAFRGFYANSQTPNVGTHPSGSPAPNATNQPIPAPNSDAAPGLPGSHPITANGNLSQQSSPAVASVGISSAETHSHPQPGTSLTSGVTTATTNDHKAASTPLGTVQDNISGAAAADAVTIVSSEPAITSATASDATHPKQPAQPAPPTIVATKSGDDSATKTMNSKSGTENPTLATSPKSAIRASSIESGTEKDEAAAKTTEHTKALMVKSGFEPNPNAGEASVLKESITTSLAPAAAPATEEAADATSL